MFASPFAPQDYWWLDALGLAACVAAWLWMNHIDRKYPVAPDNDGGTR
jgi:hypothetical protein